MNKRFQLLLNSTVLFLLLIIIFSFATKAEEIEDISEDHWAYESVTTLIDRGYISLYEDDTFRGNEKISRYEVAVIIARMLEDVQTGDTEINEADANELRKLSLEFQDELVEIAKKQEDLFEKTTQVEEKNVVQTEAIGENREKLNNLENNLSNTIENIEKLADLSNQVDELNDTIKEQATTINNLNDKLNTNQNNIDEINNKIKNIDSEITDTEAINNLKDQQSVTVTNVNSLQNKVNNLEQTIDEKNKEIEELKKGNNQQNMYMIGLALLTLITL